MKLLFVYRTKRGDIFSGVKKKLEPDHQLYGANYFKPPKFNVCYSDIAYSPLNILHPLFWPIERFIIRETSIGFKLDQAILLLPMAINSDVIVTTADSAGLPILLLKKLRILRKPIVYISTGLVNELDSRKNKYFTKIYKELLKKTDKIICHSNEEKKMFESFLREERKKIHYIPFGIDLNFFNQDKKKGEYILSIGRDRSRDFKMVAKVAKKMPKETFKVVTSHLNVKGIQFPPNVEVLYDQNYLIIRKLYAQAKLVLLPLKELKRASGQITFLESLAAKNKVVVARVRNLVSTYPKLAKSPNVYLYETENALHAQKVIQKALKTPFQAQGSFSGFSSKSYANLINNQIAQLDNK